MIATLLISYALLNLVCLGALGVGAWLNRKGKSRG